MAKKVTEYGNESIDQLEGAARVRERPAVIFGSDSLAGCEHSIFEIISNSIDEAREGYGGKIVITRFSDLSVEIEDFGRGIPVDYNSRLDKYNWQLLFCEMYAGGKYKNNSGENYQYSIGTNGLGLCATQYASEYMDVEIKRDGFKYNLHFEHGENVGGLKKEPYSGKATGTKIKWRPDLKVFTDINVPMEYYHDMIRRQAVVNAGVQFIVREQIGNSFDITEYCYENGIGEYLTEQAGDTALTSIQSWSAERVGRDRADMPDYKVKINAVCCFSNKTPLKEYYHNSSYLEYGGVTDKAVRNAFLYQIDAYLKQNNKYNKSESKISFVDIEECLMIIISSFSTVTSYENQTKKAVNNKFIQEAMTDMLRQQLEVYFIENKADAEKIAEQVLINKRSRERSEKERLNIKSALQTKKDILSRIDKFVDCRSRDVNVRELFIVEGDSALGSVKMARSAEFQAVIPVRGKILNCLKADYARIFKSEIITNLIKVLGCGVEVTNKANKDLSTFNLDDLRWSKVIICTDADEDGFQIRTLILTMFYRLIPTLIAEGKVFIAETPLYEITTKDKTYFAYDEREKADILANMIGDKKYTIQRSKGLGENQPDMMNLTTMNPETRRLIKVTTADAEATAHMFDILLGDDIDGRKEIITEKGHMYIADADVS